jgi:fatty-acid peroxygenase
MALATLAAAGLPARVAGVELLNVLRPTVAVAWPGTFAAMALTEHPEWRAELLGEDAERRRVAFGHEARRLYPFVPALAGRIKRPVRVDGMDLAAGDRIVLDVFGTDHDPQLWEDPEGFHPDRFVGHDPDAYSYLPQGGGDPAEGHRCPGEPLTVRMLAETIGVLAELDLRLVSRPAYDPRRMPTRPDRGLVVTVG